jgi:tetratricopeptide (TPR) repeat protein
MQALSAPPPAKGRLATVKLAPGNVGQVEAAAPKDSAAEKQRALALLDSRKYTEAIALLQALKKTNPTDLSVRISLVDAYFKAGLEREGVRETQEALDCPALSETTGLALAKVLVQDKQTETAQIALEKLTVKWPDSAPGHAELGLLRSAKSQFEQATRQLGRAVQLEPDSADYVQALAEVLLSWRHYSTALDFVTAEEQRFGRLPNFEYCRAYSLYGLRRHGEALAILDKLVEQNPRFDRALYLTGNCYAYFGDSQRAIAAFKKAVQLNPGNPAYYIALAEELRKNPATAEEAIASARKGLALDPSSPEAQIQLALCYETGKEYSQARSLLEAVTQEHPELIPPHRILARLYYRQGNPSEADRERRITEKLEAEHLKPAPGGASPARSSAP